MSDAYNWPAELDALIAASENHTLLFENESVRVLDTRVRPGQVVPLHTHRWPSSNYLISWSDFIRRDANGSVLLDTRTISNPAVGTSIWSDPFPPHTLENIGNSDLHLISVEIKTALPK